MEWSCSVSFPDVPDFQIISCLREERLLGQAGFNLERAIEYPISKDEGIGYRGEDLGNRRQNPGDRRAGARPYSLSPIPYLLF